MYLHQCPKCLAPTLSRSNRSQLCNPCRVVSRLSFADAKTSQRRRCKSCARKFSPSHSHDHHLCGQCEATLGQLALTVRCSFCKENGPAVYPDVNICRVCLKDPAQRERVKQVAADGQAKRLAKYRDKPLAQNERVLELWGSLPRLIRDWEYISEAEKNVRDSRKPAASSIPDEEVPCI